MNGNNLMEIEKNSVSSINRNNDIQSFFDRFNFLTRKNNISNNKLIKDMLSNLDKDKILKDENGNTILLIAVIFNNIDVFDICVEFNNRLLLEQNNNGKNTPYHCM